MKRTIILLLSVWIGIQAYALDKQLLADTLTAYAKSKAYVGEVTVERVRVKNQFVWDLNRAIIVEREAARAYGLEEVNVLPQPKAGGSFATTAWQRMRNPVAVEAVRAQAGLDIGGTLIGMHLKAVAVPVRLSVKTIGQAPLMSARTRPKFIGGSRAQYDESKL